MVEYLFNELKGRLPKYNGTLDFASDRMLRRYEGELRDAMSTFGDRLRQLYPDEVARFEKWQVSVDMARSTGGIDAATTFSSQSTVFYKQWFLGDTADRLDGVAHEFRHLSPVNNKMSGNPVTGGAYEQDARDWTKNFWKLK